MHLIMVFPYHRLSKNKDAGTANVTTQGNFQPSNEAQFVCPITGQELNGRFRFSVLKCTGHVISERAIKQVRLLHKPACCTQLLCSRKQQLYFRLVLLVGVVAFAGK